MKIISFEELNCWQEARRFIKLIYKFTNKSNFSKDYRLKDQIIGAAISIMNNIAEGFESQANREFIRFLCIARRSAAEVKNCLYIALDQSYISQEEYDSAKGSLIAIQKMADGLLRYLRAHDKMKNTKPARYRIKRDPPFKTIPTKPTCPDNITSSTCPTIPTNPTRSQ